MDQIAERVSTLRGHSRRLRRPPKPSELNPVKNIWRFIHENWPSALFFRSYDEIVALSCEAWNKLVDQPWNTMSIARRIWAHGFGSLPVGINRAARLSSNVEPLNAGE